MESKDGFTGLIFYMQDGFAGQDSQTEKNFKEFKWMEWVWRDERQLRIFHHVQKKEMKWLQIKSSEEFFTIVTKMFKLAKQEQLRIRCL